MESVDARTSGVDELDFTPLRNSLDLEAVSQQPLIQTPFRSLKISIDILPQFLFFVFDRDPKILNADPIKQKTLLINYIQNQSISQQGMNQTLLRNSKIWLGPWALGLLKN